MWNYAACDSNNVLGMNVKIRRRKENVECFNGETFKRTFENSSCSDCRLDVSSNWESSISLGLRLGLLLSRRMVSSRR